MEFERRRVLWIGPPREPMDGRFTVEYSETVPAALAKLRLNGQNAVVASLPLEGWSAEEVLEEIQRADSRLPVILLDPECTIEGALKLAKLGAYYYGYGPIGKTLDAATAYHESICGAPRPSEPWRRFLIGESLAMRQVGDVIRLIAARRSTVLITGETGTGKEMVARAIHMASPRGNLPMVAVNCTALPENLLEAELFGHVRGAFTGAIHNRVGRFEQAHRSTMFLDEIGDMPVEIQAKLLRVLQEREFQRIGSSETVQVDARVIAASNIDMQEKLRAGKFREDLFYRLNVVPISLPPLRERAGDIPLLVDHFLEKICKQEGIGAKTVSRETVDRLGTFSWPGNVRQLENSVEMAVAMSGDRTTLFPGDFPLPSPSHYKNITSANPEIAVPEGGLDFERTVIRLERALIEQALRLTGGNKKQAAEMLRLKRTTLTAKWKSLAAAG
jgi:DNA-binding NtrC family response regulator